MTGGTAVTSHRRRSRRAGRLASGVAAVMVLMVAVPAAAFAQETAPNPGFEVRCGLKVMLVLDESLSIAQTPNATAAVRSAADAFVTALEYTGTELGIIAFARIARVGVPYQEVNPGTINTFRSWIASGFNPAGPDTAATNWQDAFLQSIGSPRAAPTSSCS
jgi:hypothetical protein